MLRAITLISAPLLLIACGDVSAPTNEDRTQVRGEMQDGLFELSDMNRDIALRRAITGTGIRCQRVDGSGYVGRYDNLDQWAATCEDGRQWAVFIAASDDAQVRLCDDVEGAGLPACTVTDKATGIYSEVQAADPSVNEAG
ncbi:hypothetical protein [Sphingomicrobium flavum]|uniref:hypothetical protein n=1 Tax=Sphingomicrobium flavum TaxID=1229164 RepID=UPI0021ADEEE7|nr:hypothetical protein [Sphingomicrobium flavum]